MKNRDAYQATLNLLRGERNRLKHERDKVNQEYEKAQAAFWHLEQFVGGLDAPPEEPPTSSGGIYADMGLTDAILHVLDFSSESPTASDVRDALADGGYPHQEPKNLYASVYSTLDRLRKRGLVTKDDGSRWRRATKAAPQQSANRTAPETQPLLPAEPQFPAGLVGEED